MKNSVVGFVLVAALLGVGGLFFVLKKANNLKQSLVTSKSKTDSLLAKNGYLQNDVKKFKSLRDSIAVKNSDLEKSMTQTNSKLGASEREIGKIRKTGDETGKKYNELLSSQKDLEKQLVNFKSANAELGQENKNLTNKIVLLNDDNRQLNEQLATARLTSKDDILVETMTKGGKLNLKGKRVRKIFASMNIASDLKSPTFKIFDPYGTQLPEQYGLFDIKNTKETSASGSTTRLELSYMLSKKIGHGQYKIEILNENKHVGNLLISFR